LSSTSRQVCPVFLYGNRESRTSTLLNWTGYEGYDTTGFEYTIQKLNASGGVIEETALGNNTFSFLDEGIETSGQVLRFRVKVTHPDPQFPLVFSNVAIFEQLSTLFVPSAFSPNGDGVNDEFFVQGRFVADFQLTIFSKLGEVLYRSNRFDERWDGKSQGKELPPDTYVFMLEASDEVGNPIKQRGTILIVK
jgi:gliding motility-associated-like protein